MPPRAFVKPFDFGAGWVTAALFVATVVSLVTVGFTILGAVESPVWVAALAASVASVALKTPRS